MLATDYRLSQPGLFRQDVIAGLSAQRKTLPGRWLYDERGCEIFERITRLPEYYSTRIETGILRSNAGEMAGFIGKGAAIIEYGAGAGIRTEILIGALDAPRHYLPVDISGDLIDQAVISMRHRFPNIGIWPVVADFTENFEIPHAIPQKGRSAFLPGSIIGNLSHAEIVSFLRRVQRNVGPKGTALIGADLIQDFRILLSAYCDRLGLTDEFNLNLLARINRELGGNFQLERFAHEARWNKNDSAVEMHLVSLEAQSAFVDGHSFHFAAGETIHTNTSRKYSVRALSATVESAGWYIEDMWTDSRQSVGVFGLASL